MRINPVQINNIAVQNQYKNRQRLLNQKGSDSFVSFTGNETKRFLSVSDSEIENICRIIKNTDEARLDGSIQELYRCGRLMVKAPEFDSHNSPLKEFYALMRLQAEEKSSGIAPKPGVVSTIGKRHFVAEEYVTGEHAEILPFRMRDVDDILGTLLHMDEAGIVNQDLSPSNIIFTPGRRQRIVDFDTFSFLSEDGRVRHSSETPVAFFARRIPEHKLVKTGYSKHAGAKYSQIRDITSQEMFARSFAYPKRLTANLDSLDQVRAMSENPFIAMPSNLSGYEARTIYKRIVDCDVDNPVEFLKQYIKRKAEYHAQMSEFLRGLEIPKDIMEYEKGRLSFNEAQSNLKYAISYEELLSRVYRENASDVYFAKLEAAKMQLGALLYSDDLSKHATNKEQVHNAYEKLIKVIMDGISSFTEADKQTYLRTELRRYTEAFGNTDFSLTTSRHKVLDSLDIVGIWFGDKAVDLRSFQAAKDEIKENAIKSVRKYIRDTRNANIPQDVAMAEQRRLAEDAIRGCFEGVLEGRVPKAKIDRGVEILVQEAIEEARGGAKEKVATVYHKAGADAARSVKQKIAEERQAAARAAKLARNASEAVSLDDRLSEYAKKYQRQAYASNGGRILAIAGGLIAFGGLVYCNYKKFKNEQAEREFLNKPIKPQIKDVSVLDLVSSKDDNPFKNFIN